MALGIVMVGKGCGTVIVLGAEAAGIGIMFIIGALGCMQEGGVEGGGNGGP